MDKESTTRKRKLRATSEALFENHRHCLSVGRAVDPSAHTGPIVGRKPLLAQNLGGRDLSLEHSDPSKGFRKDDVRVCLFFFMALPFKGFVALFGRHYLETISCRKCAGA